MSGLGFDVSLVVEIVLTLLLAATVGYCAVLERRLRGLRSDQAALTHTVEALNSGIARAQSSLFALRNAATEAGEALEGNLGKARSLTDELSVMLAAGERIATRIETGRVTANSASTASRPAPSAAPAPRIIRSSAPATADALRALR